MIQEISQIIHNGLPISYIRNDNELTKTMIFEYIKWKQIESIFDDKFYIYELDEKQMSKLLEILKKNSLVFLEKNKTILNISNQSKKQIDRKINSLSWSKINSFLTNKSWFIKTYFEGEPFFETKEIVFGKVMSAILESGGFDYQEILKIIKTDRNGIVKDLEPPMMSRIYEAFNNIANNEKFCENLMNFQFDLFPNYEEKLQDFIQTPVVDWIWSISCLWFLDNSLENLEEFREFKTWKTPWTQERADNHGQITLYALLILSKTGKLPKKAYLDWIVTEENENGEIVPNGEIKTFEVFIDEKKVEKMRKNLPKIFADMQKEYEKWLDSQEWKIELNTDIFQKYADLEREKKEIEAKQKFLKKEIDEEMQSKKVDNFKIDWVWTFFYTARKKWDYSEEIKNKESEVQEEMKVKLEEVTVLKQKFEEENEPEISLSLTCRIG